MNEIQRVLLLNPPDPSLVEDCASRSYNYFEPPLGLLYVYDHLKRHNTAEVRFIDLNVELRFISQAPLEAVLRQHIEQFKPDLVAVAALYYTGIPVFHKIAAILKQLDSALTLVFGGHYPHHLTTMCLKDRNIDYAILSEGELGLQELIETLNRGSDPAQLQGIAFVNKAGKLIRNQRHVFSTDYEKLARLPWEDTSFNYYFRDGRNLLQRIKDKSQFKVASITASRGCPNGCTFCTSPSFWERKWRKREIANVVSEIRYLQEQYGVNTIIFNDENISVNRSWFSSLLDEIALLKINWYSSGGFAVRTINDERIIEKMHRSGIVFFNLAVESANDQTLKKIKKPLTASESENVVRLIRKHGEAFINAFFITGFPFETLQDVKNTLAFAESLDTDWKGFYCFRPLPGSEAFKQCQECGLIGDFNPDYGELYVAPSLTHDGYTSEELTRLSYLSNLRANFLNNRNLLKRTTASLAQAERDFSYVLETFPDHVFACLGLADVMRQRGFGEKEREYLSRIPAMLKQNKFDWQSYLTELKVNLNSRFEQAGLNPSALATT